MQYYAVVNTQTGELQTVNGVVAQYPSFYSARVERITLNDLTKKRHGFSYMMGDGWTERSTHWQVIVYPSSIRTAEETIDKAIASGTYERYTVLKFYMDGDIIPLKRAPERKKSHKEQQVYERALFSVSVKKTPCRIRRKKS